MMTVGVTGGIGSGKSTLCRLLAQRGAAVYDTDSEAKRLMAGPLREAVQARFGPQSYRDGALDRAWLASVVFRDAAALADLDAIVHPAVLADFQAWVARQQGPYAVMESALLFSAGFDRCVDRTVAVLAPEALRIERTCRRDGSDAEAVRRRIAAQMDDDTLRARADYAVVNILEADLEAAAADLDSRFRREAAQQNLAAEA